MAEQLSMFEPQGPEILPLAAKHQRDAERSFQLAQTYDTQGWKATAQRLYQQARASDRLAAELVMLSEFEALGGCL